MKVLSGKDVCRILSKQALKIFVSEAVMLLCKRKLQTQQSQFLFPTIKKLKEEPFNLLSGNQEFQNKSLNNTATINFFAFS